MLTKTRLKSIIYCRVSSQAQVKKGDGLNSQETRCREYAKNRGYEVVEIFHDEGISGSLIDRPKFKEMLGYLKRHAKTEQYIVIIDDISRLARDVEIHIELRRSILNAGGKLESPSLEFGEGSDSRLIEHVLASVAAHGREKNAEQVKHRMHARMQKGYWVFHQPMGYKFAARAGHGKVLVQDEPIASLVKEALEGFAIGRFSSISEVANFMATHRDLPAHLRGSLYLTCIREMLERVLYTGNIEYRPWNITLRPGHHEALISMQTYNKIQERLKVKSIAPQRADIHLDFPLRGFVLCHSCQRPMTACWSAGRTERYAYYLCRNPDCSECKKSVRRETLHDHFEEIIDNLTPTPKLVGMMSGFVKKAWEGCSINLNEHAKTIQERIQTMEVEIEQFLERIIGTDSITVIKAYEGKISKLETQKAELAERLLAMDEIPADFDSTFQTALEFMSNPQKLWVSESIDDKRLLLKLAFSRQLPYRRNEGFQTVDLSLPFAVSRGLTSPKWGMVVGSGLDSNCSDKLLEAIQRSSKLFDSVMDSGATNQNSASFSVAA